ncbi:MAG: glycosyltransferase family 4 protein [Candidatus Methanofastidiosa archaeon]|nr:glycosyltransferase family 4 protein [Candidatus Methanofastidiosa archaeon]
MNILFVGLYPPHIGGIATHTFNLRQKLTEMGHNVYVLTYRTDKPLGKDIFMVDSFTRMRGLFFMKNAPKEAGRIIREHDIDIIHSHYLAPPGYVGSKLTEKYGIPNVVTTHGSDINFMYKGTIGRYLINLALKRTSYVICVSKSLQRQISAITDNPSVHIPNGVDTSMFKPSDEKKEYVLYTGALIAQKKVGTIIDSLAGSGERLVVAGDGTQRPKLEWLAQKRGLEADFLGYVTDVERVMRKAKALVFPSSEEGFGLAVLEAMAAGVPTISKRSSTIEEMVKDRKNGMIYDDPSDIPRLLRELESNRDLRESIIAEGIRTAYRYTWDCVAKRTSELYSKVLGSQHDNI